MELSSLTVLGNRISSFSYFSSCDNITSYLVQRYYQEVKEILKLFKPVLDQVVDSGIASDEVLSHLFDGFSRLIDELREVFENWRPSSSKLHFVLLSESLITKIYKSSGDIFLRLESLYDHLTIKVGSTSLEQCVQKMKHIQHEQLSAIIMYALRDQSEGIGPNIKLLEKIAGILRLKTSQQILMETIALEKLKENANQAQMTGEAEYIGEMLALTTHMHEHLVFLKKSRSCGSVPMEDSTIVPNYNISSLYKNSVRLIDSMKSENLNQSCHLRCTEFDEQREFRFLPHSQEYHRTSLKSLLSNGFPPENFNLGEGNHLPAHLHSESADFSHVLPQNETRLSFERLSITRSEDSHNPNENNVDIVREHLVSPSRTDLPNISFDTKSQIHDVVFSHSNANPIDTSTVSNGLTGLTIDTSNKVKSDPPAVVTSTIRQIEQKIPLRLSKERPQSDVIWSQPREKFLPETMSSSVIEHGSEVEGMEARVRQLVGNLKSTSLETLRAAIGELRFLAKLNTENRIMIAESGAISFLVNLLYSIDAIIQEQAVTTLLNLSIHNDYKVTIAQANAIEPLIHVLDTGSPEAKENSAATLFSLAMIEGNKVEIARSGAIGPLVELLGNGTPRGKKDAATALFYLSTISEIKVEIVQAGAVKHLVKLMDPSVGLVDKAVAVLANLAAVPEGRILISREGGIPVLVEALELGSARGKENAAAALFRLCSNSNKFCTLALQEGIIPPLVVLSQSGTRRAKEKAKALLKCFKNQVSKAGKG